MNNIGQFYFHESTVVDFIKKNHEILINLEDAWFENNRSNVTVMFLCVDEIKIDGKLNDSIFMEEDDGEILTLKVFESHVLIIIEWNDFKLKKNYIKSYKFNFESVQVNVA